MKIKILGCGPSGGVPYVGRCGGEWGNCDFRNKKNRRLRASILITFNGGRNFLIDTSPDLREQLLSHSIIDIDAVLYTHDHADHTHGIDELRSLYFARKGPLIPIYGLQETLLSLQERFSYLFQPHSPVYPRILEPHIIDEGCFKIGDEEGSLFLQQHGPTLSAGYRFGSFAYSTDFNALDPKALECLKGLDCWVVDCLAMEPRKTHNHLDLCLEWINKVQPKRAILTHMNASLDYDALVKQLPAHIEPAYDGMVINL